MKISEREGLPGSECNFCKKACLDSIIDAPTMMGWAHMCDACFKQHGREPATKFVKIAPKKRPEISKSDKQAEIEKYAASLSDDEIEAMVMDSIVTTADGCEVEPDGHCPHGYPSPLLTLGII